MGEDWVVTWRTLPTMRCTYKPVHGVWEGFRGADRLKMERSVRLLSSCVRSERIAALTNTTRVDVPSTAGDLQQSHAPSHYRPEAPFHLFIKWRRGQRERDRQPFHPRTSPPAG